MASWISVREEFDADFDDLIDKRCWSGAVDTLEDIRNANKEDEFMDYLSEVFYDDVPELTQLNDFIWFERDAIYEACGLDENGELPKTADDVKESIRLIPTSISGEDFYEGEPYMTVHIEDENSDFEMDLLVIQYPDGTIDFDVEDYPTDPDYIEELANDNEILELAGEVAMQYIKDSGKYDFENNRLIVNGEY